MMGILRSAAPTSSPQMELVNDCSCGAIKSESCARYRAGDSLQLKESGNFMIAKLRSPRPGYKKKNKKKNLSVQDG